MNQDWLSYLTVTRFGINTEQMPTKFLIITEVPRVLISILNELTSAPSYWTFGLYQNQRRGFSSLSSQPVVFAAFAPVQFASGGEV
jgi:hypothetical protein